MKNSPMFVILTSITRLSCCLILMVSSFSIFAEETLDNSPEVQLVIDFHDKLLHVMQNADSLGYQGRYEVLSGVINSSFNIPYISRVILGRHWSELDESQRAEFISLYEELITVTYASRFDGFDNDDFIFKNAEDLNRGRKLVRTVLQSGDGENTTLDYLMVQNDGQWMILSVIANGANDISIKRGEYADIIKLHGYQILLDEIRKKILETPN